jgi:hypothetical protein
VLHPIGPSRLLRQADDLAGRGSSGGQPDTDDLRRAVSAAYYALFHHTVLSLTGHLLPTTSAETRFALARHITHRAVNQVCTWMAPRGSAPVRVRDAVGLMRASPDLVTAALAFIRLYQARHDADYNHLANFRRDLTLDLIDRARGGIASLDEAAGSPPVEVFFAHVALTSNL